MPKIRYADHLKNLPNSVYRRAKELFYGEMAGNYIPVARARYKGFHRPIAAYNIEFFEPLPADVLDSFYGGEDETSFTHFNFFVGYQTLPNSRPAPVSCSSTNDASVSSVSAWEIAIKYALGRLSGFALLALSLPETAHADCRA